mmetsp:Transcript_41193/g.46815  ORF Transcript_41193/g.46815 Transcript_41193/m.46815 type:complete len:81 (-) Transcript_41193:87-329(-)
MKSIVPNQFERAPSPKDSREAAGRIIDERLEHPWKARFPIEVREESTGNSIDTRLVQSWKVASPMNSREAGTSIDTRLVH